MIADHLRASSFLVADGVLPSNEGRGYVLRRIMRRAMRHAQLLGAKDPIMYRLVPALVREMGQAYPELIRAEPLITETLRLEESRFRKTLERGLSILDEETREPREGPEPLRRGGVHALRHLRLSARSHAGRLEVARHRRRHGCLQRGHGAPARKGPRRLVRSGDAATETVWFGIRERVGATEFLGYDTESAEGVVAGGPEGRGGDRAS